MSCFKLVNKFWAWFGSARKTEIKLKEISKLHNKIVNLKTVNEMLVDTNIEISVKNEMIEKVSSLKGIK